MTYSEGPRLNEQNNPGGARWCTEHFTPPNTGRLECSKPRRAGRGPCHAPAVRGTDACKLHGGAKVDVLKAKGQARISAWSPIGTVRDGKAVDASAAVIGMLQQSWMRAHLYGQLLQRQVVEDGEGDGINIEHFDPSRRVQAGGLIGFRYGAAGKEGIVYAVSEEARALVTLEAQERDRVVKYAKTAHDMGISDKMVGLAERWGDQVVGKMMIVLAALNLTAEQEAMVPSLVQAHLGSIELGA